MNRHSSFSLRGRGRLVGGIAALCLYPSLALSQTAAKQKPDAVPDTGEAVVVTGARGVKRTVTKSTAPIDVISSKELLRTGKASVISQLNNLVPSFNSPYRAGGGTSTIIATGALRGLNPDQTLILVNGKRRHKTSLINAVSSLYNGSVPTDLDMIPASEIDHIEVLRDGAAAQYGSDAIAGVINIILKKKSHGMDSTFTGGANADRGDGEQLQWLNNAGTTIGRDGYFNLSLDMKKQYASNRANPIAQSVQLYPKVNGQPDPREATADRMVTTNYGAMPQESLLVGYNAGYDFGRVTFYTFGTFGIRDSDLNYSFRSATNANSLPQVYPNGFYPRVVVHEQDYQFAAGLKGTQWGWDWDLSTTYGQNQAKQTADHTINASLGPSSPLDFYVGTLESSEWDNAFDITHGWKVLGHLQSSLGFLHRLETYRIRAGDPASYAAGSYVNNGALTTPGANGASGFTPEDAGFMQRNNMAGYVDLAWDPTRKISIGLAGRYEHYDDSSGNSAIGKLTGRYQITRWLAIRGTMSNGFRAPSLAQDLYASTTGQFRLQNGSLNLLDIKTLPVNSPAARALGATPLKPETSANFSAGMVLTPFHNFNVTLDAYQIEVFDRIALTGTLTGNAVSRILVANGLSPDISAQYYSNAMNTRTRGLDVVATYAHPVGRFGSMQWNVGWNYNQTVITNIKQNPSQLSSLGSSYVLFDRLSQGYLTKALPKTKLSITNIWTWRGFTFNTRLTRFGSYTILQNSPSSDRTFGARVIVDEDISYQINRHLNVGIGANNLFNTYPSSNGIYNALLGQSQYPGTSPFGFTGGYYYGRVGVSF
ncbi:TonB-dependent receptor [Ameyamaea chiangmaiensis NBRC 103196]|uniref:TonB-dependent receptor n=1 Tax=Ameyamaea chiangmaiensis TaxID=442969 RepID=A0A850PF59_9PROT|nr:TonB-dependent receptor [Ameyamaea chiangmaiensis]MBS4075973.1 TonB-dependent receptor [Ameyamaea chiangmaiensis]NVN39741.1 TonB-dependent receptor [Ameyamaea chiangmaiensis]GBQ61570.1 TonB-dependent receptor [Ameyamaea chiangmaiensis NBRC 103196]